jgi:hypothetical protein
MTPRLDLDDIHERPTLPDPIFDLAAIAPSEDDLGERPTLPDLRIDTRADAFFAGGVAIEQAGRRWISLARVVALVWVACAFVGLVAALRG